MGKIGKNWTKLKNMDRNWTKWTNMINMDKNWTKIDLQEKQV